MIIYYMLNYLMAKYTSLLAEDLKRFRQYYQKKIAPRLHVKEHVYWPVPVFLVALIYLASIWVHEQIDQEHLTLFRNILIVLVLFVFISFPRESNAIANRLGIDSNTDKQKSERKKSWEKQKQLRWRILRSEVGRFLGLNYKEQVPFPLDMLRILWQVHILPYGKYEYYSFWGEKSGRLADIFGLMYEDKNIFVLMHHLRTPLKGEVLLLRDGLNSKWGGYCAGKKRVKLEWLDFEKNFDLFADSEQEARVIMQPDMMQAVYDFYQDYKDVDMCFLFKNNQLAVVVSDDTSVNNALPQQFHQAADYFFCQIWFLLHIAIELEGKGLASPWQEKEYLAQRRQQEEQAPQPIIASALSVPKDQPNLLNLFSSQGLSPSMKAIINGDMPAFTEELNNPILDVNQCFAENGNSLLHLAALNGQTEMLRLLLAHPQIRKNVINHAKQTPLDLAKLRGHEEAAKLLLNN